MSDRTVIQPPDEDPERTVILPPGEDPLRTSPRPGAALPPPPPPPAAPKAPLRPRGKKRADVNSAIDRLNDKHTPREVSFSGDEAGLEPLPENYETGDTFAEGGQGIIRRAFDRRLRREVAMKSLRKGYVDNPELRSCFLTEARVTAQLDHPAVVPIYTINTDNENGLHLAMKMVRGQTFKAYLDQLDALYRLDGVDAYDEGKALRYRLDLFLKICDALEYAHSRKVMHCDLKPANIMIGEYRETYIMDWGIARPIVDAKSGVADPRKQICGTPQYLAPEAIRGEECDQRADIFAMGSILFETVLLKKAFSGKNRQELMTNIRDGHMEHLTHRYHVPVDADLKAIIRKAMANDPDERYRTIGELSGDLRRCLAGLEVSARPDNLFMKTARWFYLHRRLTLIISLVTLLALLALAALGLYREFRFSEQLRAQEFALGLAYSRCTHAGHLIDEQFFRLELMTAALGSELQFQLDLAPAPPKIAKGTVFTINELKAGAQPGIVLSTFHQGNIYPDAIVRNAIPGLDPKLTKTREATLARMLPRLQQIILESPPNTRLTSDNLALLQTRALEEGTPIIRVFFGFPDGLFIAYPAGNTFPANYDPRNRNWYKMALAANPEEGPVWLVPYIDSVPGIGLVLSCAAPMQTPGKRGDGVCAIDISLAEVIEGLHYTGNSGRSVLEKAIVDDSGQVIVSTSRDFADAKLKYSGKPGESITFAPLGDAALLREMKERKFGLHMTRDAGGREVVYLFCHIHTVNWFYLEKLEVRQLMLENARRETPHADQHQAARD